MNAIPDDASVLMASGPPRTAAAQSILYVEDEPILRWVFSTVLLNSGYQVDVAEDGQAGWEALCVGNYDLLITDNDTPRLTGLGLVKRLRAAGHSLPVVMASGSFRPEDAGRDSCLQLAAFLQKPFTAERLLGTVADVLRTASRPQMRSAFCSPVLDSALSGGGAYMSQWES